MLSYEFGNHPRSISRCWQSLTTNLELLLRHAARLVQDCSNQHSSHSIYTDRFSKRNKLVFRYSPRKSLPVGTKDEQICTSPCPIGDMVKDKKQYQDSCCDVPSTSQLSRAER